MVSTKVLFAKGPVMDSIGFKRQRTDTSPIIDSMNIKKMFDYPIDKPGKLQPIEKNILGRKYYNMKLEDFEEYKAFGEPIRLHGPSPYHPILCACDRYIISSISCVCSMVCREKPLYKWAKEHPEEFQEKQKEMSRWRHLWALWNEERVNINNQWYRKTLLTRINFQILQDMESPINCAYCERNRREYCHCACDECGNKFCNGYCRD